MIHSSVMKAIIIIAAAFTGCNDDNDVKPLPPYEWSKPVCDTTLKVVWQKMIDPDSAYGIAILLSSNGKNIFWIGSDNGNIASNTDPKFGYFEFDNDNKIKEVWTLFKDRNNETKKINFHYKTELIVHNGKLIYTSWHELFCFSENGELLWKNIKFSGNDGQGNGGPFISGYGNNGYFPSDGREVTDESYLYEVEIETGKERLLFTELVKDNLTSHLDCPVMYTHNKDTIAAFQSRKYNIKTLANRADVMALNISKNKVLWRVDSLDRYAQGSSNPILFENNKLYYAGAFDIYCLDAFTGKLIWRQAFDNYHYRFNHTSMLLLENGLVAKSEHEEIALLDKETGAIIWENRGVGTGSLQIELYKGDLIMSSSGKGTLECLDSRTGLLKWKAKAPNRCIDDRAGFGLYSFVINPKTNLLYICDKFFIQCLKLPGYD
jgi:outer membrane protein assembly factor BamB